MNTTTSTSAPLSAGVTGEASADVSMDSGDTSGVYYCPQGSCVLVLLSELASGKMYSVALWTECTRNPGWSRRWRVTQSLSHQEAFVTLKRVGLGSQGGKILHRSERQEESLTPKWLMIFVFFRHLNSLQPPRGLPKCAKVIVCRCMFRHLKRRAIFARRRKL